MSKLKNETGNKYSRWTVLKYHSSHPRGDGTLWLCKCSCGTIRPVLGARLRNGGSLSCGCYSKEQVIKANRLQKGEAAFNAAYLRYKKQGIRRNLVWELSKEQFKTLVEKCCYYCKKEPNKIVKGYYGEFTYSGIDRLDNNIGYTIRNCVPCCKVCNYAKHKRNFMDFITWIKKVYDNFA